MPGRETENAKGKVLHLHREASGRLREDLRRHAVVVILRDMLSALKESK